MELVEEKEREFVGSFLSLLLNNQEMFIDFHNWHGIRKAIYSLEDFPRLSEWRVKWVLERLNRSNIIDSLTNRNPPLYKCQINKENTLKAIAEGNLVLDPVSIVKLRNL